MSAVLSHKSPGHFSEDNSASLRSRFVMAVDKLAVERSMAVSDPSARLRLVLQEIDETVLPRILVIDIDGAEYAKLRVSNRRLRQIAPCAVALKADLNDIESVALWLLDLALVKGAMSLRSMRGEDTETSQDAKYSAASLMATLQGRDPADRLVRMLACDPFSVLTWQNSISDAAVDGDNAYHALLRSCAEECLAVSSTSLPQATPYGMAFEMADDRIMVVSGTPAQGVAFIAARADVLRAISRWQLTHG